MSLNIHKNNFSVDTGSSGGNPHDRESRKRLWWGCMYITSGTLPLLHLMWGAGIVQISILVSAGGAGGYIRVLLCRDTEQTYTTLMNGNVHIIFGFMAYIPGKRCAER
jgi:hypothetical protein